MYLLGLKIWKNKNKIRQTEAVLVDVVRFIDLQNKIKKYKDDKLKIPAICIYVFVLADISIVSLPSSTPKPQKYSIGKMISIFVVAIIAVHIT